MLSCESGMPLPEKLTESRHDRLGARLAKPHRAIDEQAAAATLMQCPFTSGIGA